MTTRRLVVPYLCGVVSPVVRTEVPRRSASTSGGGWPRCPSSTLLPPEPVLCAEYGVSRITLRRAVDGLVADGHLVREQGRGTYVTRPAIRHEYRESFVHRIAGFSSVMSEQGAQVGTKVLTQRDRPRAGGGGRRAGARRHRPTWSSWSGCAASTASPTTSRTASCRPTLYPRAAEAGLQRGLAVRVPAPRVRRPTWRTRASSSTSAPPTPSEADLLRIVAGSPLLVVRTTVRDSAGHPLVHSFSRLRPDVSQVEFEVSVGGR